VALVSDRCDVFCYDEAKVTELRARLRREPADRTALVFKALADETRVKIALSLCYAQELCVCDVALAIGATIPNVSHHLRMLKSMGLAKSRKDGKLVFYSVSDEATKRFVLAAVDHASGAVPAR